TIAFAIPAGPQTIQLQSPLPSSIVPLVMQLDGSQDVVVISPTGGGQDNYDPLMKVGAGRLTISGADDLRGNVEVNDGSLAFDVSTAPTLAVGFTPTVDGTGNLELDGTVSALSGGAGGTNILNNSSASAGLLVRGSGQLSGNIDGTGTLTIAADGALTANHVVQRALVIGGSAGHPATLSIAASDALGNPLAAGRAFEPDGATSDSVVGSPTAATIVVSLHPQSAKPPIANALSLGSSVWHEGLTYGEPTRTPQLTGKAGTICLDPSITIASTTESMLAGTRLASVNELLIDVLALDHNRPHRGRAVASAEPLAESLAEQLADSPEPGPCAVGESR
ncbi:MAG TPA: hypothetical protein VKB78_09170, partial [Pirellulales bacterium]|nr:hypothetical protein [Pirellulales bacterium]